ncbi:hypothetical protein [Tautonia sociabilis]|uniref:Uncharacterized protein n=1 Tax=Tautonia sociabilis TaxID=2080755 RepID=A0A432MCK0_9BACT|nr:hypothetical protein [Tautonia sociabilis]RUL81850.1 hypothetical protein TsocGM_24375 [Tautonia sociabilis]
MGTWRWVWLGYVAAAGGYGGWRGEELGTGWGPWCILLLPAVIGFLSTLRRWVVSWKGWQVALIELLVPVCAAAGVGGQALLVSWGIAAATGGWSAPAARAAFGAGVVAVVGGLVLASYRSRVGTPASEATSSPSQG